MALSFCEINGMNGAWQRITIKSFSQKNEKGSYWARFLANDDGYQVELTDLQNVWRSVCDTEELVQRHVKYNPQLEIDLDQLPTILRDRFFPSDPSAEKDYKMRYRIRSEGGLELRCLSQIAYCEFRWIFRVEPLSPEEASLFLKQVLIEPLLCAVNFLQEKNQEVPGQLEPHRLTAEVSLNATTVALMCQYVQRQQRGDLRRTQSIDAGALDYGQDDTDTLTSSFMDHGFASQTELTQSLGLPHPEDSDNEDFPASDNENHSPAVVETDEELVRRVQMEEKITRQKRKRERGESKTRKKRKIQLV